MTVAIGYTRLSQDSDTSIDRQKRHIREYASDHGFELETIYDDGERSSGFETESRDEYQRVRERVRDNDVDAVVVNDKRRLARDFDETMRLILDLRKYEIEAHTFEDGQLDLSDPMQVAIEVVQAASEHKAKKKEIERAKEAVRERQEDGCYQGTPPFGLEFAADKCHLQKNSEEWETLEYVWGASNRGESYAEIEAETGLSKATISRINSRGRGHYTTLLNQYSA